MSNPFTFTDRETGSAAETRLGMIAEAIGSVKYDTLLIRDREENFSCERYIKMWNEIFLAAKEVIDETGSE